MSAQTWMLEVVKFPESPAGAHCAWLWDLVLRGGADLDDDDLQEHVASTARSFGPLRSVATLRTFAQNGFLAGAQLRDIVEEGPDRLVLSITTPSGLEVEACVDSERDDGRIATLGPRLPGGASATAVTLAGLRAAHYVVDGGGILADTLADAFSGEVGRGVIAVARADPLMPHPRWNHAARSRWAEDSFSRGAQRVEQYVILGAGLDSFAYRGSHRSRQARVFEVDHPLSQAWKRQRPAKLRIAEPKWVT